MQIIRWRDYDLKPWKNGRGTTREIASQSVQGTLAWRLSLAMVESDGPFSNFYGLERILTVVRGDGMRLLGVERDYEAQPFVPVRFPGGEKITGLCRSTPVENFNLIFDPDLITAEVRILDASEISRIAGPSGGTTIVHVLDGQIMCDDAAALEAQDTGVCERFIPGLRPVGGGRCAVVTLAHSQPSYGV
ncbi:HutD family protein [Ruegeria sp. MALMAid1280]|uniref:HutD/Ves family protein n=1 Tax=Ruegeria sp. MALMAid1280 TaxID=3411634 RepID=UPI003BA02659